MKAVTTTLILFSSAVAIWAQDANTQKQKISLDNPGVVTYSKDQQFLAVADGEQIRIYIAATFKISQQLRGHSKTVSALSFSPDGKYLLSAGKDRKIFRWDYLNGSPVDTFKINDEVINAQMIDNSTAAVITDTELVVIDLAQKKQIYSRGDHKKSIRSLAVSGDGKRVLTGAGDGTAYVYDTGTGDLTLKLEGHKAYVRAVSISTDGNFLATGDDDGVVIIRDAEGKLKYKLKDPKGWVHSVTFSHDSKYVSIGDDWGNIFIYSMEKGLLTEKIDNSNVPVLSMVFSPDGKELSFTEQRKGVTIWSVSRLNIASIFKFRDAKDLTAPQIFVSNPPNISNDKIRFSKDQIDIRGTVMDESGVRSLRINAVDVPIKENGNFIVYLPLSMGDNAITMEAKDINDNISIKKFIIHRRSLDGREYDVTKARNYLFVVGINDYEEWPKLNNAVRDANDVTNVLMQQYGFEFDYVTVMKNEQATRSNIYKSLRALIEKVTPQDNLVIYYSGHGFFDELLNEGYWIPVEASENNTGEYLSNSDILKIIGNIDSQHTFLIADACFSGSLFADSKRGFSENVERYKSRWGLASGRLEVVSDGEIGKNSPFASVILQFLNENTREKTPISELVQFVKIKVAETSNQTPLGNPLKVSGDEGGELVLYRKQN